MKVFNESIKSIIEKFSYDFHIVQQDTSKPCACVDFTTKQPDPGCKKCLGMGYKVVIRKIRGSSQDSQGSFRNAGIEERVLATSYFIDAKYPVFQENIIVDNGKPLIVHRIEEKRTANREPVYRKVYAVNKKGNPTIFMKHFSEVIKGA